MILQFLSRQKLPTIPFLAPYFADTVDKEAHHVRIIADCAGVILEAIVQFLGAAPQAADRNRRRLVGLDEDLLGTQRLAAFGNRHVAGVKASCLRTVRKFDESETKLTVPALMLATVESAVESVKDASSM